MNIKDLTEEYRIFLLSLDERPLNTFLSGFKEMGTYKMKEHFLNKYFNKEIFNILIKDDFLKVFYIDSQAKYILEELNLSDLDNLKTLIYCYNTNSKKFNQDIKEQILKKELLEKGFKEQIPYSINEKENILIRNKLKELNDLKVICVFDRDKIGLLGGFQETEEHKGKLIFIESETKFNKICFMPKGHTKTGQILNNRFFYKELKEGLKEVKNGK